MNESMTFLAQLLQLLGYSGVGGTVALIIVLLVIISPFLIRMWNWTKESTAQATAQHQLYTQLAEQLKHQRDLLDAGYVRRNELTEEVALLKGRLGLLEDLQVRNKELQQQIEKKDAQIHVLMQDIISMKEKIHALEIRLAQDERSFCMNAPGCNNHAAS